MLTRWTYRPGQPSSLLHVTLEFPGDLTPVGTRLARFSKAMRVRCSRGSFCALSVWLPRQNGFPPQEVKCSLRTSLAYAIEHEAGYPESYTVATTVCKRISTPKATLWQRRCKRLSKTLAAMLTSVHGHQMTPKQKNKTKQKRKQRSADTRRQEERVVLPVLLASHSADHC